MTQGFQRRPARSGAPRDSRQPGLLSVSRSGCPVTHPNAGGRVLTGSAGSVVGAARDLDAAESDRFAGMANDATCAQALDWEVARKGDRTSPAGLSVGRA